MVKKEESKLKNLKKDYSIIQKKYKLPEFEKLNKDFQIEKTAEIETENLIREVRKFMADKFSNYLRFIEALLNPVNVPMFFFSLTKSIGQKEKDNLTEVYKKLAKIEVSLIEVDLEFSEEKEAKFIIESFKIWQDIKKDLLDFTEVVKKGWDSKIEKNSKGYFG